MKYASEQRYRQKLRQILLGAGLDGISQHKLNQKTKTLVWSTDTMIPILDEWERLQWVQKFTIRDRSKRPMTVWRATNLLQENFSVLTAITTQESRILNEDNNSTLQTDEALGVS